ncbi:hypothetical protein VTJ83DRAFT_1794 [Remersonia thermophila]|uniref:Uncharacterized protein n=1 Tax=Remersonia thermophila TaxID=72144 RepID=A0ABR4DHI3_9PEZI
MAGTPSLGPSKGSDSRKRKEPPAVTNSGHSSRPTSAAPTAAASSRATKRVKVHDARHIRTQPSDAALDDGKLDLQRFLAAREFEIKALQDSMRKCKAVNATRVFQQVPRAMRRRTASHNARRVPKRLREQARREMMEDNTPTVEARKRRPRTTRARIRAETAKKLRLLAAKKRKRLLAKAAADGKPPPDPAALARPTVHSRPPRPKIRRDRLNEPPRPDSKFRKRQINKTWLPTHLWHAKRAKMTDPSKPLWRFAIPLTPTEKCYRPTHRAVGQKGVVAWDASYMSAIAVYGTAGGIEHVLKALGLVQDGLWGARGARWRAGARSWSGLLSRQADDGRRDIGPATLVWNPEAPPGAGEDADEKEGQAAAGPGRPNKKKKQPPPPPPRQLLIRTHPACFLELFEELLRLAKAQTPRVHVEDLRFEIGSIELTGPGSTEALLGVLRPFYDAPDTRERHAELLGSLAGVSNPACLPRGALLAFSARDPRLAYPPKTVGVPPAGDALAETLAAWPGDEGPKPFDLLDRDRRFQASRLPSPKAIHRRKGRHPPGEPLPVTPADPPIPVLLLASRPPVEGQAQGTWTVLAPWRCIMPLWYALMHHPLSTGGNPRLGGLHEQRQIAFEQGVPWFPADFPATDAGARWELEERARRRQEWERRPKGKRVAWASLDLGAGRKGEVGDGLACDFEHLLGLRRPGSGPPPPDDGSDRMDIDSAARPEGAAADAASPLARLRRLPKPSFLALLRQPDAGPAPANAIVTVTLTFVARGVATTGARIYRLPSRPLRAAAPAAAAAASASASSGRDRPISHDAEVSASDPAATAGPRPLPPDLRDQWLRKLPGKGPRGKQPQQNKAAPPPRMDPGADMATRRRLLARSLVSAETPLPYPRPPSDATSHPPCPGEEDLMGFVTTGSFSLAEGRATAVGSVAAGRALEAIREAAAAAAAAAEGRLCVVRNAGESVGWLARWELA